MIQGIGIDLGTGTTGMAVARSGGTRPDFVRPYPARDDVLSLDSAVSFHSDLDRLVTGKAALRRLLDRKRNDESVCHPIKEKLGEEARFPLGGSFPEASPQEHAAYLLAHLVSRAAQQFSEPVESILRTPAVVAVPANATEDQKLATMQAARLVGFEDVYALTEPQAAAYTYLLHRREYIASKLSTRIQQLTEEAQTGDEPPSSRGSTAKPASENGDEQADQLRQVLNDVYDQLDDRTFLIYDFGAGTFDAVVGRVSRGPDTLKFETLGRAGSEDLGGYGISVEFVKRILSRIKEEQDEISIGFAAQFAIFEEAERAKIELSELHSTRVETSFVDDDGDRHFVFQEWDRSDFQAEVLEEACDGTMDVCDTALKEAERNSDWSESDRGIDHVFMVGGSSRIPYVQRLVEDRFGREAIDTAATIDRELTQVLEQSGFDNLDGNDLPRAQTGDPVTAVAGGAALAAATREEGSLRRTPAGATLLEDLGIGARSAFSLWWNSGGDEDPEFHLICDRGDPLPGFYTIDDLRPIDERAKTVAWSVWQSEERAEELQRLQDPSASMKEIGRIVLKQDRKAAGEPIEMTIQIQDDGEIQIEAVQGSGDHVVEERRLPSVFVPQGHIPEDEAKEAEDRIRKFMDEIGKGNV